MKKLFNSLILLTLILSFAFISCGPSKKVVALRSKVDKLQQDSIYSLDQLNKCNSQVKILNDEKSSLQNENTSVQNDLKSLTTKSNLTIADQAKRMKALQDLIQSQRDIMSRLKNSIANALMNYKTDELSVYTKDGNVYVQLEENLLFKSGSDIVDPKGKEALKSLAMVLNSTTDITVMVEGHTDNVSIKTTRYKDNWDLSTARATSIVRILTKDYGFDSNRITASGRSNFHPIDTNDTPEGRARNRRTEIILKPDLNEMFKLLDQED